MGTKGLPRECLLVLVMALCQYIFLCSAFSLLSWVEAECFSDTVQMGAMNGVCAVTTAPELGSPVCSRCFAYIILSLPTTLCSRHYYTSLQSNKRELRRRQWHPTPVLLPGKSHGRRSLVGCSPWGRQELDTTEQLHFHFSLSCMGEGNGNPLQSFCLENPRDGGAWWAAVSGVAQCRT